MAACLYGCCILRCFVTDPVAQVSVMFITIFGVMGLLYNTFFVKRGVHNSQVLVLMFQLWIMVDLLHYTVDLYAFDNLGGAAFAMVLNCIIPNKTNTYWLSNAVFYSRTITMHMKKTCSAQSACLYDRHDISIRFDFVI